MSSRNEYYDTSNDNSNDHASDEVDLYSLLKLDRHASTDDIHRSYRTLSTTFHPDKLPHTSSTLQQIFLDVKKAHDILIDPVLRLTYDNYGEEGVVLLKRLQMEQQEHEARKEAATDESTEEEEGETDDDNDEDDEDAHNLYKRLEKYLLNNNYLQARQLLQEFMMQHDYHQNLAEDNQVHLNLSLEFPRVIDLKKTLYSGKKYLQFAQKRIQTIPMANEEEREYYQQRILRERQLVDYQFTKFKDSQQAEVGFTLTSTQPRNVSRNTTNGKAVSPKWSMAMGASTTLIYPEVTSIMTLVGKQEKEQHHPVSVFVNTAYQPIPQSQINLTANLSNNDSHQFIVGSAHTFSNQTACRYNMTFLTKSPLSTPLIINIKTYRHLKDIGMATGSVSVGGNGDMLQWNAKWEAHRNNHKVSASASVGMLQGNSIDLSYRMRFPKFHWLEEFFTIPKKLEITSKWGQAQKVEAMVTQEFSSLANHPTLGFGMEHDVSLGRWTWIWELQYNGSSFRIPIPVLHLGSLGNLSAFYSGKLYYAFYCLMFQSMIADILRDPEEELSKKKRKSEKDSFAPSKHSNRPLSKTRAEAERQLKLMEPIAERKRFVESQRQTGLLILQASYWCQIQQEGGKNNEILAMDATKQLQFWVSNGKLSASGIPKSSWLGFYNLRAESIHTEALNWDWRFWRRWRKTPVTIISDQPQLTIRYRNTGKVFELTVAETESFVLPCNDRAECLGDASYIE